MEVPSKFVFLLVTYLIFPDLLFQLSNSATLEVVIDGVSEWKNPTVFVGDSIILKHKNNNYLSSLYIFRSRRAFKLCNFTQATMLTKPNSTSSFTWHPSRPGVFYFSFNNGSAKACPKLAIRVTLSPPEDSVPSPDSSPVPVSGGIVSSSPAFPWPFRPRQSTSPSPAPATSPSPLPGKGDGGGGEGFINSNPAVPLPTGEVDSATIRPLSTSGHGAKAVGLFVVYMMLCCVLFLVLL